MTTTPNIEATHLAANQNQPEVTVDAAFDKIDKAVAGQLSKSLTSVSSPLDATTGSEKTLWLEQTYLKFTGVLTGNFIYEAPANKKLYVVEHACTGNYTITVKTGTGGGSIVLRIGEKKLIYSDGTDTLLRADLTVRLPVFVSGKPTAGQVILRLIAPFAFTFKAGMPGAKATHKTNPTATATFTLKKNGSSFATVDISTGGAYTFTQASDSAFAEDDILTIEAPGSQDATLDDVNLVFPVVR